MTGIGAVSRKFSDPGDFFMNYSLLVFRVTSHLIPRCSITTITIINPVASPGEGILFRLITGVAAPSQQRKWIQVSSVTLTLKQEFHQHFLGSYEESVKINVSNQS